MVQVRIFVLKTKIIISQAQIISLYLLITYDFLLLGIGSEVFGSQTLLSYVKYSCSMYIEYLTVFTIA